MTCLPRALRAQRANLREISLAQRRSPKDTAEARTLLRMVLAGAVQALVVSCEIQFLHLYQVARTLELAREFVYALRKQVTVAVVGTSARDILEVHGVRPQLVPAQPQLLIAALMQFLNACSAAGRGEARESPSTTNTYFSSPSGHERS